MGIRSRGSAYGEHTLDPTAESRGLSGPLPQWEHEVVGLGWSFSSTELVLLQLLQHLPATCRTRPAPSDSKTKPGSNLADLRAAPSPSPPRHCPHFALFVPALCSRLSSDSFLCARCLRGMPMALEWGWACSFPGNSRRPDGRRRARSVDGWEACGRCFFYPSREI